MSWETVRAPEWYVDSELVNGVRHFVIDGRPKQAPRALICDVIRHAESAGRAHQWDTSIGLRAKYSIKPCLSLFKGHPLASDMTQTNSSANLF